MGYTGYIVSLMTSLVTVGVCQFNSTNSETELNWTSIGCVPRQHQNVCYTVNMGRILSQSDAAKECSRRHATGRLAMVLDEKAQTLLAQNLRSPAVYWIGAQLKLLDEWTWVDGSRPDTGVSSQLGDDKGYAVMRKSDQHLRFRVMNLHDPAYRETTALCRRDGCMQSFAAFSACYFNTTASTWFEARNRCLLDNADLAVLSSSRDLADGLQEDTDYFVGLRNVQVVWLQAEISDTEAKYTRWASTGPRQTQHRCVALGLVNFAWDVFDCDQTYNFICEYTVDSVGPVTSSTRPLVVKRPFDINYIFTTETTYIMIVIVLALVLLVYAFMCPAVVLYYKHRTSSFKVDSIPSKSQDI